MRLLETVNINGEVGKFICDVSPFQNVRDLLPPDVSNQQIVGDFKTATQRSIVRIGNTYHIVLTSLLGASKLSNCD